MRRLLWATVLVAMGAPGCSCQGPKGSVGPPGPLTDPPHILAVSPESGSSRNVVTITGENFVDGANTVYFGGDTATIVSESATQIVVQPANTVVPDSEGARSVPITVITSQQSSNAYAWEALPSGTPRLLTASVLTQIGDITSDGTLVYFSDFKRGILTADPANAFHTATLRGLGGGLRRPGPMAFHPSYGLVVVDDLSTAGDLSIQQVMAVDITTGETQVLLTSLAGLSDAMDIAVDPANGDIYIATDGGGATNFVWRLSDADGFEPSWGNANLDSVITSIAVVGANVYVGGTGANTGLFEFAAGTGGGGAVNQLKSLDNAVAPLGLAPHSSDLMVLEDGALTNVADLGTMPSTVTAFNNFPMSGGELDLAAMGSGFVVTALDPGAGAAAFSTYAADADTYQVMTQSPSFASVYNTFAIGSDVYYGSIYACLVTGMVGGASLHRLTADGSMEVVGAGSSCGYASSATSAGLIVTTDIGANTVSTVDPATGTVTQILDAGDGVVSPYAALVGPGDAIYVMHAPGGVQSLGLTDVNGSSFDPTWADTQGLIANMGRPLGNTFVFGQIAAPLVYSLDPGTGTVTPDFVDQNELSGVIYGMSPTPDGNLAISFYDSVAGGLLELTDTGDVTELYRSDPNSEISLPIGVSTLPTGDFAMAELGTSSGSEGDPIVVTP